MDLQDPDSLKASIGRFAGESQMLSIPIPARFKQSASGYLQRNVKNFIDAIVAGEQMSPSFADGLHNQEILEAALTSVSERSWIDIAG